MSLIHKHTEINWRFYRIKPEPGSMIFVLI